MGDKNKCDVICRDVNVQMSTHEEMRCDGKIDLL